MPRTEEQPDDPTATAMLAALPTRIRHLAEQHLSPPVPWPTPWLADSIRIAPTMDDLHQAITLDDPTRTIQTRLHVLAIERVLRSSGTEVRRDAIAAIVAVLLRVYAGNPDVDHAQAARSVPRIKDSVINMARKYFGPTEVRR